MANFRKILSVRTMVSLLIMQASFLVPTMAKGAGSVVQPTFAQDGRWAVAALAQESSGWVIESYKVSKNTVAWTEVSGDQRKLFAFDGTGSQLLATMDREIWDRDVQNGFYDAVTGNYDVADGRVVWTDTDGSDREIYQFTGGIVGRVSDNTYDDRHPITGHGRVAWTSQPSQTYNLMVRDGKGMYRLDSWHVPNYAFSDANLYWLNRLPNENWFRVFVNDGAATKAVGQGDDRPISPYFLTDGKGSAAWEYSTKQWSYDKRRTYISYKGAQAYQGIQRDVPPNVTYLEDMDGSRVVMSVHDLLTTMLDDYSLMVVDGGTERTVDHVITAPKVRYMDGGYIRHLVAENGSPLTFTRADGTGESQISLDRVVYDVFDADGPTAAGAIMNGDLLIYRDGIVDVIDTTSEVSDVTVSEGDVAWLEGASGVRKLSYAATGVLVKAVGGAKVVSGSLVKSPSHPAVYLAATDGKRYTFPSEGQYFSWYADFDAVQTVSTTELASIPLAGNVLYAPGSALLKEASSPNVYVIGANGTLHWATGPDVLVSMVGTDWKTKVRTVPVSILGDYTFGEPVSDLITFQLALAE